MTKRREFLQLAKTYRPTKDDISGWYLSEKLDGTRCLWDGGVTRGMATELVPWAGVLNPKTGELKDKIKPIATGLWSRYGNPIMAPDWFLDKLPPFPCDGELWAGRQNFQLCRSICGGDSPDPRFNKIKFAVFSSPPKSALFEGGLVKNTNMLCDIKYDECMKLYASRMPDMVSMPDGSTLEQELFALQGWGGWDEQVFILRQIVLKDDPEVAILQMNEQMNAFLDNGAEGVILRDPYQVWTPKRIAGCLKFKPWEDDEGTVVGFTSGRETNKGSKLLGMIGAIILDYNGKRLEVAGLTNEERQFNTDEEIKFARENPGVDMPPSFQGRNFKLGDRITFKYRELSDEGIPKEARYWRVRGEE